jgi:hypothetical protein
VIDDYPIQQLSIYPNGDVYDLRQALAPGFS